MAQQFVTAGLNWGQIRAILNNNADDVEDRLAQIETGGIQILASDGPPTGAEGNVGDYYIDNVGLTIYGPKQQAGWGVGTSMSGFNPRGAWSNLSTYNASDVVTHLNSLWLALRTNTNVEPMDVNSDDWSILGRGDYYRGEWVNGNEYRLQHTVKYEGNIYRSISTSFTSTVAPDADPTNWQLYIEKGEQGEQGIQGIQGIPGPVGANWRGTYSAVTEYDTSDVVTYRSKGWRAKIDNITGVEPTTDNTTQWEKIYGSFHNAGAWSSATAYRVDDIVSNAGNKYRVKTNHTSTATAPGSDTTNYELWLEKGATGDTGPAGADGEDGAQGPAGPAGPGLSPGDIKMSAINTVPSGWLDCNGQAVSRATYSALYTALGGASSPWGQGDGINTFNVPDLRGRAPIGVGTGAGLTARTIAQEVGAETHPLTSAENGPHTHTMGFNTNNNTTQTGGGNRLQGVGTDINPATSSSGSGTPHNNMQPSLAVKFLIKT